MTPHQQALQDPVAVLAAKGFEERINQSLREQGAAPLPPNKELDEAARRHANEIGKQMIAKLEAEAAQKARDEAFLREFECSSRIFEYRDPVHESRESRAATPSG
jgi:hypothetical protein